MVNKNDRWSALSLKDRADLMNMYITNGISDLKEMKKHYNSFGNGGDTEGDEKTLGYTTTTKPDLEDVETFNSNWYKYRDKQLADAVRAYHAPQHITRGLSFWQNSFPGFVNDTKLANGARNYINERLEALKEFTIEEAVKDKQAKQILIDDYYKYFPNEKAENEVEIGPPQIPDNQSLIRLHNFIYKGGYSKPAHLITYTDGYENTSTKIHERAHASFYQDVLGYHSVLKPISNVVLKQGVNAHKYYDKLTEVYSRLMQLRFENNIDPTHTYTLDEVKAMRNDPNFKDHHIFDRYTDESILMLLNEVAHNTTDSNRLDYINPENIAASGGKLNKFSGEEDTTNKDIIYYDDTYIEPAAVKAFNSQEDYNRYYGEQFGKKVAEGINNAAPHVLEATMLPFTISGAIETPMLLYQGVKAAPQLIRGAKTLLTKGKKALGKKVLGMVDDMNGYVKEGSHFRIVDKPAIDDAISSGTIRSKTGLYHGTPEYLRNNFSKYLDDIPGWESMDANELRNILENKGAFEGMSDAAKFEAKLMIRNSTNHGGTVGYFKDMPYPNYTIHNSNYVIETPESIGSFVAGHGGKEFVDVPLEHAGATLLKTNGSVKGASIPSKGSSYWEYSPFFEMWKNKKFNNGGKLLTKNKKIIAEKFAN